MNELQRMQEEVSRANQARRVPEATPLAPRVEVDFGTPWEGPPPPEGIVLPAAVQTPATAGGVAFASVNIAQGTITTTDGRTFPIEPESRKALAILCLEAMQLHFNRTVERMAKDYGVWVDAPTTPPAGDAVTTPPSGAETATAALPSSDPPIPGAPARKGRRGASAT